MNYSFREAGESDAVAIWEILQGAIARRKADGSRQWQDGYPNPEVVNQDIANGFGYVLTVDNTIAGYCALMINNEPAYDDIVGKWLTNGDFVAYHRVAISEDYLGHGLAKKMLNYIETFARDNNIKSIKVDTNFDNPGMLNLLDKFGYTYCGEVFFRGAARKAFEKVLD